jgi:hypothetical protein
MSATAGSGVEVVAIDTPALGDRSYLAHGGDVALVINTNSGSSGDHHVQSCRLQ